MQKKSNPISLQRCHLKLALVAAPRSRAGNMEEHSTANGTKYTFNPTNIAETKRRHRSQARGSQQ